MLSGTGQDQTGKNMLSGTGPDRTRKNMLSGTGPDPAGCFQEPDQTRPDISPRFLGHFQNFQKNAFFQI